MFISFSFTLYCLLQSKFISQQFIKIAIAKLICLKTVCSVDAKVVKQGLSDTLRTVANLGLNKLTFLHIIISRYVSIFK